MAMTTVAHPKVVSREQWLAARRELLAREKELTRAQDALSAQRRRLPMVEIVKPYIFEGPGGERLPLGELFDGRRQLIVYHFMFDPDSPPPGKSGAPWEVGCPGCSFAADQIPHLSHLHARDTSFILISRAPQSKILPFKKRMGWTVPWYSSYGSDFNYDFHTTVDEAKGSTEWNYRSTAELREAGKIPDTKGELPALSCFLRMEEAGSERIFHTYSAYSRGLEPLLTTYHLLDLTAYGRQEDWEASPAGWPKTSGDWVRHHDKYVDAARAAGCCCHPTEIPA